MRRVPRYWERVEHPVDAQGRRMLLRIWGWSTTSAADATERARARCLAAADRLVHGREGFDYYPRSPLREEVLHEITSDTGELIGVVTRNRMGVDVLNTDALLFADVDPPRESLWRKLVGRRQDPVATARAVIDAWAAAHPQHGVRTYRTAAGLRVVVTGMPPGEIDIPVLEQLGSDAVYVLLCGTHETYRARLTPKPERVGLPNMSLSWPYAASDVALAHQWLAQYRQATPGFATCELLAAVGPPPSGDEARLLDLHDRVAGVRSGRPLA